MKRLQTLSYRILLKMVRFLPLRRQLPALYYIYLYVAPYEPGFYEIEIRYLNLLMKNREKGVAIDVGANFGLWSYRLAQLFSQVYAFEINQVAARRLSAYRHPKIKIIYQGLSSREAEATLYIPVVNGQDVTGWATLEKRTEFENYREKTVKIRRLDSFDLKNVAFIKIDVEGHEVEVLEGSIETLRANRPLLNVEIAERNMEKVASFMAALDYTMRDFHALTGIRGFHENHLFIPNEKMEKLER